MPDRAEIAGAVIRNWGRLYSAEVGIEPLTDAPAPLYRWLVAATLFSARIGQQLAVRAALALDRAGWRTPEAMTAASWEERVHVLNRSGYARYDESTARMLGQGAELLCGAYAGDLRNLREAADRSPARERALLKEFKGIGNVGADIFFREVQLLWDETYPFADSKALKAAKRLGLPTDADGLAALVEKKDFARLLSGLVRIDLAKSWDQIETGAA